MTHIPSRAYCPTCQDYVTGQHSCFPISLPRVPAQTFKPGDSIIVTTACEEITMHELTGQVTHIIGITGTICVKLDVDDSHMLFFPHELGHRY